MELFGIAAVIGMFVLPLVYMLKTMFGPDWQNVVKGKTDDRVHYRMKKD